MFISIIHWVEASANHLLAHVWPLYLFLFLSCANGFRTKRWSTPPEDTSFPLGILPTQSHHTLPPPAHITLSALPDPEWMLHSSRWPCFFALQSPMIINWEGCWMHLHTYHINTDKVACAKQARQTASFNSQLDLRQSWTATEQGNKCIFHGRHVRARGV